MEEDKAAAYYEELTRKGEGAARFKQGLGFSSAQSSDTITKGSTHSSSFLSSFVKASGPTNESEIDKQAQLEKIQNKLKKKPSSERQNLSRVSDSRSRDDRDISSSRSRSRDDYDDRKSSRRDRDRDREGERHRDRGRSERRVRSRSRSRSRSSERRQRHRRSSRERRRSRSTSPRDRRQEKSSKNEGKHRKEKKNAGAVDYPKLIKGYADMTPADKVKAKMKFQLSQTAEKDADKGMGAGWERFDFDKDAPLDDEEIEAAEDDALVVKKMGQSFRFSAVEARREEEIKAAHDEAMFGAPVAQPSISSDEEPTVGDDSTDNAVGQKTATESDLNTNLLSDKVLAKQQGSWRDRARKIKDG